MTSKAMRVGGIAAIVMAIAIAAPLARSQSTAPGDDQKAGAGQFHRHGRGMSSFREFRQLNLTDDQKAQIQQIRKSHFDSTAPIRQQVRTAMKSLHDSTDGSSIDESAIAQKLTEIAPLQAKLMADRFKMRQEISSVLTADQKAKLDQLRQQERTKREEFRSRKSGTSSQD
ncbi:MAG TPA: Spy/CpxP family protein refolding chaperone [Blastocatellia bacterium]|nr:Spy/CpxP family protein refolding chaperone [Blastocatellia bacterium]